MALCFIGEDIPQSSNLKELKLSMIMAKVLAYSSYFKDNINMSYNDVRKTSDVLSSCSSVFYNSDEAMEIDIENKLWGFDYIIRISSDEYTHITTNNVDDVIFKWLKDHDITIEYSESGSIIYNKEEKYPTTIMHFFIDESAIFEDIRNLFINIAKDIPNINVFDRWIHTDKGWSKTRTESEYRSLVDSFDIYDYDEEKSIIKSLFHKNESIEYDGKLTAFDPGGIVYSDRLIPYKPESLSLKYVCIDDEIIFPKIYIPEDSRYAIVGWVKYKDRWIYLSMDDYIISNRTITIDGDEYILHNGILDDDSDNFELDDDGILHKKVKEDTE